MVLPNKAKIPVGTILAGKYRTTREIGRGGMAAVYEAAHVEIGKRVAIKVLAQELTTSAVVVERFLREARAAAAIRSPYICDVYDSGSLDDGRPFLVLELLEGESLYERMTKIRCLDVEATVAIVNQTCRGLTKAHAASIVHRDLKPENIFLTKDEEGNLLAKILDFGLAKFYAPVGSGGPQARLTREGAVFGTPAYMSPEQVRGQGAVDHRADLWALGCIVFECFTGRTVWSTEQGVAMTFAQIANSPLPSPATYRPDLSPMFTAWFERALDRDISKRFQTAKEFAGELAASFNQERAIGLRPSSALLPANPFLQTPPTRATDAFAEAAATPAPAPGQVVEPATKRAPPPEAPTARAEPLPGPSDVAGSGPASPRPSKLGFVATGGQDAPTARAAKSAKAGWAALVGGVTVVAGLAAYLGWRQFTEAPPPIRLGQSAAATAGSAPLSSATTLDAGSPPLSRSTSDGTEPPWMAIVREGQQAITEGDYKRAIRLLKEAYDKGGGHGVPRTMLEHLAVATASFAEGPPCKLTGLARPRMYGLTAAKPLGAGRPSIAVGPRGAVIVWTDAHEGPEHAYAVAVDDALRNESAPVDVTPEATNVNRPDLRRVRDRLLLSYADAKGPEAGVHARFLEPDGRIASPAVAISPAPRSGSLLPSLVSAPDGSIYAAWSDEIDADSEDIFVRHLGGQLELMGDAVRATDLVRAGATKTRAKVPSLGISGDALHIAYRVEREPQRAIEHLRLPLTDVSKGLAASKRGDPRTDRTLGEVALVNTDKSRADAPSLACSTSGCVLVWNGESGSGASAAFIDPTKAQPIWRKKFSRLGGHAAVSMSAAGLAQVVWFEANKVVTAAINRDGVGPPTRVARVTGDQAPPSIAPGAKPGEWYLAWLDYETGHLEAYAARVQCK